MLLRIESRTVKVSFSFLTRLCHDCVCVYVCVHIYNLGICMSISTGMCFFHLAEIDWQSTECQMHMLGSENLADMLPFPWGAFL